MRCGASKAKPGIHLRSEGMRRGTTSTYFKNGCPISSIGCPRLFRTSQCYAGGLDELGTRRFDRAATGGITAPRRRCVCRCAIGREQGFDSRFTGGHRNSDGAHITARGSWRAGGNDSLAAVRSQRDYARRTQLTHLLPSPSARGAGATDSTRILNGGGARCTGRCAGGSLASLVASAISPTGDPCGSVVPGHSAVVLGDPCWPCGTGSLT